MLITIDGCSGAGKTTLADNLIKEFGFAELSFDRRRRRIVKRTDISGLLKSVCAFQAFKQSTDVERPYVGRHLAEPFWEPCFLQLFIDEPELFQRMVKEFDAYMGHFMMRRPKASIWLDVPYQTSCNRAAERDGKPLVEVEDNDCWRNFALHMESLFPYFHIVDAAQPSYLVFDEVKRIIWKFLS